MAFISNPLVQYRTRLNNNTASTRVRTSRTILKPHTSARPPAMSAAVEKGAGMKIIKAADEATIEKMGCRSWGTWGCPSSNFPWTYSDHEVCLLIKGNVVVTPDGGGEPMVVEAGDIAYFPKGMSCTWDVSEAIQKHFSFGLKL